MQAIQASRLPSVRQNSSAHEIANTNAPARAQNPRQLASGGGLVRESAKSAFADYCVERSIRKIEALGVSGLKMHAGSKSFIHRKFIRSLDVLRAVVNADNLTSETLCQKNALVPAPLTTSSTRDSGPRFRSVPNR